jgi:HTH-type transcriptional regulator, transcriptional repressor of NAD biosynthesis genes
MIRGFVTGGFRPFHKGHEALIDYAKANCDQLVIFVADPPGAWEIPWKYRVNWVSSQYLHDPQVEVFGDVVKEPKFKNSEEKSKWWGNFVLEKFGKIDRVFSSESYGKVFAEEMGAENWVFNESRTIVPVSATLIRNKPITNWNQINNFAKDYFVKKICIVGTESTGKTTLCQQLAGYYKTTWSPELGREIFAETRSGTLEDIKLVGLKHAEAIIRNTRLSNKILFVDTDLKITKSYSEYLFGEIPTFAPWIEKANEMDLYIYLMPNAPYIQDGTRLSKKEAFSLHKNHRKYYEDHVFEVNYEKDYLERFNTAVRIIDNFISKY